MVLLRLVLCLCSFHLVSLSLFFVSTSPALPSIPRVCFRGWFGSGCPVLGETERYHAVIFAAISNINLSICTANTKGKVNTTKQADINSILLIQMEVENRRDM